MDATHLHNQKAWDERVRQRKTHTRTAQDEDFADPLAVLDECGWFEGPVAGKRVLCLAAGGGKHSALFAALGAVVTVVDISGEMLDLDRKVAAERGLKVRAIEASMDHLPMLGHAAFDLVMQPVSTSYVQNIRAVYAEVARVLVSGGLYISQHKQPACLQADQASGPRGYVLAEPYYRTGPLPAVVEGSGHREAGTLEFLHRWEDLVGGLCQSGFVIEDLIEPRHADPLASPGTFAHRSFFLPPFVTIKARRRASTEPPAARLWTPS